MGGIIIPKTYIETLHLPLIFLAGPIKGATNWQEEAIKIIFSYKNDLRIASPRREVSLELQKFVLHGPQNYFPRQRVWERYYLNFAAKNGAILFWLPGEVEHNCQKVYGAMTRKELGDWSTHRIYDNSIHISIGSDGKFSEWNTLKYDLSQDTPDIKINRTLEETCLEALKLIKN